MKMWKISLVVVVLVCIGGLASNQALGVVALPFGDGFENRPVGDYPDENGWEVLYSPGNESVSNVVANTGTKSFNLDGSSNYIYIGPPASTPNQMSYEVSFYIPTGVEAHSWAGFANPVPGDKAAERNAFNVDTTAGVNEITFGAYYDNRPEGDPLIDVGSYTPGTWVTVRADLDYDTLTADLWLNGVANATDVPIKPKTWTHPDFGVLVSDRWAIASSGGDVYFDDVTLTPEPATLGLLLLGGLVVLRKRRK